MQPAALFPQEIQALTAGAGSLTIDLGSNGHAHWIIGVQFYKDSTGTASTPTAGTIVVDVKTEALPDIWQRLPNSVNLASVNEQLDWAGPSRQVRVTLAGMSGDSVSHYRAFVASTRS